MMNETALVEPTKVIHTSHILRHPFYPHIPFPQHNSTITPPPPTSHGAGKVPLKTPQNNPSHLFLIHPHIHDSHSSTLDPPNSCKKKNKKTILLENGCSNYLPTTLRWGGVGWGWLAKCHMCVCVRRLFLMVCIQVDSLSYHSLHT